MSEEKKEECCGPKSGSCCGVKKLIAGVILGTLIFACGYVLGKGGFCQFASGDCTKKMCPVPKN